MPPVRRTSSAAGTTEPADEQELLPGPDPQAPEAAGEPAQVLDERIEPAAAGDPSTTPGPEQTDDYADSPWIQIELAHPVVIRDVEYGHGNTEGGPIAVVHQSEVMSYIGAGFVRGVEPGNRAQIEHALKNRTGAPADVKTTPPPLLPTL